MTTFDKSLTDKPEQPGFFNAYRQTLPAIIRHPATWLLTLLWLSATVYLLTQGKAPFIQILFLVSCIPIMLLGIPLTQGAPPAPWETAAPTSRGKLWLQASLTLLSCLVITAVALFGTLLPSSPLATSLHGSPLLIGILAIFFEAGLPLALVVLLGARWRELGFSKGYHIWRMTALWCVPSIILLVFGIVTGKLLLLSSLVRFILLLIFTAIPEEVAFRGIITTRLIRLLGTGWGIALTALVFGLLHLGTDLFVSKSGAWLTVFALTIFGQMPAGVFLAVVFQRTRSLIPGVIAHTLMDTASVILLS